MARTSKTAVVARTASGNTSIALLDQELNSEAAALKQRIGQPAGNKIKTEPAGNFILPDGMNLGNEIQVVVVDFVSKNTFYSTKFNPNAPTPPECYAIGKEIDAMAPEEDSPHIQHDACRSCALNQFGSGEGGRSKACKNSRLLAVLLVDPDNPRSIDAPDAPLYTLEVPPTSLRAFDGAVAHIARNLAGPPVKAILTLTARPAGTYALINFIDPLPNPGYAVHYARRAECRDMLYRKPDFAAFEARKPARRPPAPPARRAAAGARR